MKLVVTRLTQFLAILTIFVSIFSHAENIAIVKDGVVKNVIIAAPGEYREKAGETAVILESGYSKGDRYENGAFVPRPQKTLPELKAMKLLQLRSHVRALIDNAILDLSIPNFNAYRTAVITVGISTRDAILALSTASDVRAYDVENTPTWP